MRQAPQAANCWRVLLGAAFGSLRSVRREEEEEEAVGREREDAAAA